MPETTLQVLKDARALIADPARWNQYFWACTPDGIGCSPDDPRACAWCAAGAINNVTPRLDQAVLRGDALELLDAAVAAHLGIPLPDRKVLLFDYNDSHTHAQVLAVFDTAIARLENEASHA